MMWSMKTQWKLIELALIRALQCCFIQLCMSVYSTTTLMMVSKHMTALTAVLKLVSTSIARTIVYQIRYSSKTIIHSL